MKNTATQAPADAAAVATAHRPETETKPATATQGVVLSADEATECAAWLRHLLADSADADGGLNSEALMDIVGLVGKLEGEPAFLR